MSNSNIDLTSELHAMISKLYPNGTTLSIKNGQVHVSLPITDGKVESDGYETFYLSSID